MRSRTRFGDVACRVLEATLRWNGVALYMAVSPFSLGGSGLRAYALFQAGSGMDDRVRGNCGFYVGKARVLFSPTPQYYRYPVEHHVRGKWASLICFQLEPCLSIWVITSASPSPACAPGGDFRNRPRKDRYPGWTPPKRRNPARRKCGFKKEAPLRHRNYAYLRRIPIYPTASHITASCGIIAFFEALISSSTP